MHERAIANLEPGKVYTYREILAAISVQSSTAEYILQDLLAAGRVERCLHTVLDVNGYKLKQ